MIRVEKDGRLLAERVEQGFHSLDVLLELVGILLGKTLVNLQRLVIRQASVLNPVLGALQNPRLICVRATSG